MRYIVRHLHKDDYDAFLDILSTALIDKNQNSTFDMYGYDWERQALNKANFEGKKF